MEVEIVLKPCKTSSKCKSFFGMFQRNVSIRDVSKESPETGLLSLAFEICHVEKNRSKYLRCGKLFTFAHWDKKQSKSCHGTKSKAT